MEKACFLPPEKAAFAKGLRRRSHSRYPHLGPTRGGFLHKRNKEHHQNQHHPSDRSSKPDSVFGASSETHRHDVLAWEAPKQYRSPPLSSRYLPHFAATLTDEQVRRLKERGSSNLHQICRSTLSSGRRLALEVSRVLRAPASPSRLD